MKRKNILFIMIILIGVTLSCSEGLENKSCIIDTPGAADTTGENQNGDEPGAAVYLESLTISRGYLNPEFSPETLNYRILLESEVSELSVTTGPSAGCSVESDDSSISSENNTFLITITKPETILSLSVSNSAGEVRIYSLSITRMEENFPGNSSFEDFDELKHPLEWEKSGSGELLSTDEFFHTGGRSGTFTTLTSSISGREIISSPVEIVQGKSLIISGWFCTDYIENLSPERIYSSFKIYYFCDAGCTAPASTPYSTMSKTGLKEAGAWEKIAYTREPEQIPADAEFIRIGLRACYDKDSGGTADDRVFFDDISLQQ